MLKKVIIALGAWAGAASLALLASPTMAQTLSPATEEAIDLAMRASVDSGWTAGGAVAVMRNGVVVFARGYGMSNLETGTRATPDSVFRVGSLTKQFTAVSLLLLAQDGKLSLDDRAGLYLPQISGDDPTTIRQLLNHTAGFRDYVGGQDFDRIKWLPLTSEELVSHVLALNSARQFPAGTGWAYSSSNYALAGAIVEKVSGKPLREFMAERLFGPLGMTHTALDDDGAIAPGRASGYDRLVVERPGYRNALTVSLTTPFAAGALRSTVGDLLIWSNALTHDGVLNPESYREMLTTARLNDGSQATYQDEKGQSHPIQYALGIGVTGDPAEPELSHDGAIDGFTSMLTVFTGPNLAVAILVNTSPSQHLPFDGVMAAIRADPAIEN
ncbi:MAG: serine hydrolase domain-containing protein [Brevundimonas sp.]